MSDGEPSILPWRTKMTAGVARLLGVEVVPEESAVGDAPTNGLAVLATHAR